MIRVVKVIGEGVFWSAIAIALLWLTLPADFLDQQPPNLGGLLDNDFARRWDGTCAGWTRPLATFHVVGDLLLWIAYAVIALVMWRLHPIIKRVPTARITVPLICSAFLTCGAVHLFSAYVVFNPIYVFSGSVKIVAGVIGCFTAVYIAHDLVTVFDVIEEDHQRLKELEAKLTGKAVVADAKSAKRSATRRIVAAIVEGVGLSLLGLLLWAPRVVPISEGFFRNDFASQWSGACTGWTKSVASLHITGSLLAWTAYVLVAIVMLRLHPVAKRVRSAKIMLPLVSVVIGTCGLVHLLDAYAIFNPMFVVTGSFKIFVAVISLAGAVLVSQTLVVVFDIAVKERQRLMDLESTLGGGG